MIAAKDADNIARLLKELARESSTENTIAFLADNGGMLQSCKTLLGLCRDGSEKTGEWLQKKCTEYGVQYSWFLQETGRILQLFQADNEKEESYEILGLSRSAGLADVKRAYRRLSVQYHPDTAGNADQNTTEQFVRISKAYQNITHAGNLQPLDDRSPHTSPSWRYGKGKGLTAGLNIKALLWTSALILASVISCVLIARIYSQKVMLSTLHQNGAAFVPPAKKSQQSGPAPAMTFAEKMKIAEAREKAELAARQKESKPAVDKAAAVFAQSEQKAFTTDTDAPAGQDKENLPPPKELLHEIPAEIVVDSPNAQPAQEVKQTTNLQSAEPEAKKSTAVATAQETLSPGLRTRDSAEIQAPAVQHITRPDEQRNPAPHSGTIKKDEAQAVVVEKRPVQAPPKNDVDSASEVQQRIDEFISEYCRVYGNKNLMEFTRFFELDATENGKPISDLTATYVNLFASTQNIALQISTVRWQESPKGQITLNGTFTIDLVYHNAEAVNGRGKIDFLLVDDGGKLQIKKMTYSFDQ